MKYRDSAHAEYVADQRVTSAKKALVHYFRVGVGQYSAECQIEMEAIVDDIVEAAVARIEKTIHTEREELRARMLAAVTEASAQ